MNSGRNLTTGKILDDVFERDSNARYPYQYAVPLAAGGWAYSDSDFRAVARDRGKIYSKDFVDGWEQQVYKRVN